MTPIVKCLNTIIQKNNVAKYIMQTKYKILNKLLLLVHLSVFAIQFQWHLHTCTGTDTVLYGNMKLCFTCLQWDMEKGYYAKLQTHILETQTTSLFTGKSLWHVEHNTNTCMKYSLWLAAELFDSCTFRVDTTLPNKRCYVSCILE